ncbi:MAG: DUF1559 domain-containing protein, partial [Candidatus Nealsonbacteria bacterium]|nr:DUF1559 domain-containing protein [Candidatus Nealsonbacteria bacterium]
HNYQGAHGVLPPGVTDSQGPIASRPQGQHVSWLVHVLPYIDEQVTFQHVDLSVGVYSKANAPARDVGIELFVCPSYTGQPKVQGGWMSNYAGCHHDVEAPIDEDNHGVFYLNSHVSSKEILDGATHTIFVGEKLGNARDLGWMSGTRATLRNTGTPINCTTADTGGWSDWEEGDRDPFWVEDASVDEFLDEEIDLQKPTYVGGFGSDHPALANFLFGDGAVRAVSEDITPAVLQQLGHRADGKLLTDGPTRGGR